MSYSDELYHHGIKGQRWGVRNGPPYPLNAQTHASVVRSAGRGGRSGKKRGKIGSFFEYNADTGLATDPVGRFQQKIGMRDKKSLYTRKGKLIKAGISGAVSGVSGGLSAYKALQKGTGNKKLAVAGGVGAGLASGALGSYLGSTINNGLRKGLYGPINKNIIGKPKSKIKGVSDEADKKARRKRIARNIAIGAGATAAAAGLGYLAYKNRQKILSRRLKGSEQQRLTGNLALPGIAKGSSGDGWSKLGKARMANGKRVGSAVAPGVGSGKKFKFTSRSTGTSIVPANTNRQLGYLNAEPRRLNWKRVAAAAGGAAALGGGTAAGISAYRRRKRNRRR